MAEAVRAQCIEVAKLGAFTLRNVRDPVELFAVNCAGAVTADVIDPVCRMRVQPAGCFVACDEGVSTAA